MIHRLFRAVLRAGLWFFVPRKEVDGRANLPDGAPVLLLPNHVNALLDPLVIQTVLERPVHITARSTLSENLLLKFLMKQFHVIPFFREQDRGARMAGNLQSLQLCVERLQEGAALCIFPEGQSHSDPHLRPFKHGAARIALQYQEQSNNHAPLRIVPVGLHFQHKDRLRSAAWVRFGDPIDVAAWRRQHPDAGHRDLTEIIEAGVRQLTLNFEQEREARVIHQASEVLMTGGEPPAPLDRPEVPWSERVRRMARLREGYELLVRDHRETIVALAARVEGYHNKLRRLGIRPHEVYLSLHPARAALFVARELSLIVLGLLPALWGLVHHFPAVFATRRVARKFTRAGDQWASNSFFAALVLFPLWYGLLLTVLFLNLPLPWAGLYAASLPLTGMWALLYRERTGNVLQRAWTFLRFLRHRKTQHELAAEGRAIIDAVSDLEKLLPGRDDS